MRWTEWQVAVVVPVFREADNIASLIGELRQHLNDVFVDDDSEDGTADVVRSYARTDERVRLVLRVHERGLHGGHRWDADHQGTLYRAYGWRRPA